MRKVSDQNDYTPIFLRILCSISLCETVTNLKMQIRIILFILAKMEHEHHGGEIA